MSEAVMVTETKGVSVTVLDTVDLGPEIARMDGRPLRMRMVPIEPGSVFGRIRDHRGRPRGVYIPQWTITDHRDGVTADHGQGVGWPAGRNTTRWLEKRGTVTAVKISVDIVGRE